MKYSLKKLFITMTLLILLLGYLFYNGYIHLNNPTLEEFPIRGIDVSAYQGNIEWDKVKNDGFKFVYIKATEGKDFTDSTFIVNWENAKKVNMKRGAYHFFTFGSHGTAQAAHFINVVPKEEDCLPPVVDVEFGGNSSKIPSKELLQKELRDYIYRIENHYNRKPILYVTYEAYEAYIMGDFEEYTIWIRDVIKFPYIKDNRSWSIWQYNNRGRVNGISAFVDLNVFNGKQIEFNKLINDTLLISVNQSN